MVAAVQSRMPSAKPPVPATAALPVQPPLRLQARADTCYATDWTPDEQVALDAALDKFPASRHSALERYVRAAAALKKKTVRDVALRVRWLATSSNATKRRLADDGGSKKRPRVQSIFAVQPRGAPPLVPPIATGVPATGVPAPYAVPAAQPGLMPPTDDATGGSGEGPMSQLLEQNYLILNQYKQNMQQYKVHENTELLVRFRDNILTILNQMSSMSGLIWQNMPPLPVRLNVELASNFLPKAGTYPAAGQPIFQAAPGVAGAGIGAAGQFAAGGAVAAVVPVGGQGKTGARQEGKTSKSKSKSGSKRSAAVKVEETKPKSELRTSARRAAQKAQPSRSTELRSSARLAAAADSEQS